ncbi:thermostable phytase [Parathielavia appendiculata]|uniref:Thermostable phytase n=1 Tax=Parathielavia appendiculata TaxID=2587402 RepID=A0AAN6U3S3_9PEZI|nr:thermostable phytase [Parathielavia appendiculata]
MGFSRRLTAAAILALSLPIQAAAADVEISVSAVTSEIESDWTSIYYGEKPLLLGNDGSPATGGWLAWSLDSALSLNQVHAETTGRRTKVVTTIHGREDDDDDEVERTGLVVSIGQPDSILRAWESPGFEEVESARTTVLGDWSALCSWKSPTGNDYVYLFGKKEAKIFFVHKDDDGDYEDSRFVEIQTFPLPVEASGCATSPSLSKMFVSADDDKGVYVVGLAESTAAPAISKIGEAEDDVTGVAVYVSGTAGLDYLLVAMEDTVAVYAPTFTLLGNLQLVGHKDIEIQGLSIYQGSTSKYPSGVLAYAIESEDITGFGVSSLDGAIQTLGLKVNTKYDPSVAGNKSNKSSLICSACSKNGYCNENGKGIECSCFAGWQGKTCNTYTCEDNCSGHGKCAGPNQCKCNDGWGGLHCSFVVVRPVAETEANGGDGDDPAIWISPTDRSQSRIITTTKSEEGAGLGVFDLSGKLLQTIPAGEPNNVDVIYNFQAGSRKIDLAYAACRDDNTLCLFEITANGTLATIPGGSQPTPDEYEVYGSCTYRSPTTNKQYLFVNAKSSQYLQYELSSAEDGNLTTTLVRSFFAGSGGQVEGCVSDEQNGFVFIGEEPHALWRYDAEPTDPNPTGVAVATVGDGHLRADVEGVTLVYGKTKDEGFIIVSTQGVSAYNVYKRKAPHEFVLTFTIAAGWGGRVDAVSNTDGIAAVGTGLGDKFPKGLVVVHDDANELAGGKGTSAEASFKLLPLDKVLGPDVVKQLGLLDQVDSNWDPRALGCF